jgi:DNA repair protein RadC
VDDWNSPNQCNHSLCRDGRDYDHRSALCPSSGILGVPDAGHALDRHANCRTPQQDQGARRQLTALLGYVFGNKAGLLAETLIDEFGSLSALFAARPCDYLRLMPGENLLVEFLSDISQSFREALSFEVRAQPHISNSQALTNYLYLHLGQEKSEQFRVLFLDTGYCLLRDQLLGIGSISEARVYPREIIKRALELGAASLILVHNHPSGDPAPSTSDIELTRRIAQAARLLDIGLSDHIIIARRGWSSLRALGLL